MFCRTQKSTNPHKDIMAAVNKFMDFYNDISENLVDTKVAIPTPNADSAAHFSCITKLHECGENITIKGNARWQ